MTAAMALGRWVCGLLLLGLGFSSCGFQVSSGSTDAQLKSLSHVLAETDVQTCSKLTAIFPPYMQVTSIWAGRVSMEECLKALYPY